MMNIQLQSHVGPDGILKLEVPVGLNNTDLDVTLIVQPLNSAQKDRTQDLGWPPGFLDKVAGSMPDLPERAPQGEYEIREELG